MNQSLKLGQLIASCVKCERSTKCTQPLAGGGAGRAPLLLVLESPDSEEDLMGKHLSGRGGMLMKKLLSQAGITSKDVFITHLVKCHSKTKGIPPDEVLAACKGWLWKEIMTVKPRGIIACGDPASKLLLRMAESEHFGPFVGKLWPAFYKELPELQIMPMWSPVYLLRKGQTVHDQVVEYLKTMKEFVNADS